MHDFERQEELLVLQLISRWYIARCTGLTSRVPYRPPERAWFFCSTEPSPKFFWILVAVLAVVAASWFVYSINRRPLVTLDDGRVVRDMSAAEAGAFAEDRFSSMRTGYLQSLEFYKTLAVEPLAASVEESGEQFDGRIEAEVAASEANNRVAERVGPAAMRDLARQVALVAHVAGGLPRSEYERRAGTERTLQVPVALDESLAPELFGSTPPGDGAIRQAFARLYDAYAAGDGHLVEAVAVGPEGWLVALFPASTSRMLVSAPPEQSPSGSERENFVGRISSGALQFHGPPTPWTVLRDRNTELDRASVTMIVATRSGDRYPLQMYFYFDPETKRWELLGAWQRISVEAMQSPPLTL